MDFIQGRRRPGFHRGHILSLSFFLTCFLSKFSSIFYHAPITHFRCWMLKPTELLTLPAPIIRISPTCIQTFLGEEKGFFGMRVKLIYGNSLHSKQFFCGKVIFFVHPQECPLKMIYVSWFLGQHCGAFEFMMCCRYDVSKLCCDDINLSRK